MFETREELTQATKGVTVACIGPITAQTVRACGLTVGIMAATNTIPGLVDAIVKRTAEGSMQQV